MICLRLHECEWRLELVRRLRDGTVVRVENLRELIDDAARVVAEVHGYRATACPSWRGEEDEDGLGDLPHAREPDSVDLSNTDVIRERHEHYMEIFADTVSALELDLATHGWLFAQVRFVLRCPVCHLTAIEQVMPPPDYLWPAWVEAQASGLQTLVQTARRRDPRNVALPRATRWERGQ